MSVWRDKRGRLHVGVMYRGRRVHRTLPEGATQEDARRFETKLRLEAFRVIDLGQAPAVTCLQAIQRWLDEEVAHHKAVRITTSKAHSMELALAGKPLAQIHLVAASLVDTLRGTRSPATINRKLAILKRVANLAYKKWGWLKEPLGDKITLLAGERPRQVYLDASQVKRLIDACTRQSERDAVLIAAYTGLRRSELWSLIPGMVRDNTIYLADSKTGSPRAVPVIPKIRAALNRWMKAEKPNIRTFYRWYQAAVQAAGLRDVTYHDLRHSCASMLINAGVDLYTVGEILGHKSPAMSKRYAHLSLETKRRALRRIG